MKKLFFLFSSLLFVACSDSKEEPVIPDPEPPTPAVEATVKVSEIETTAELISFRVESENAVEVRYLVQTNDAATPNAEYVMKNGTQIETGESIVNFEAQSETTYNIYAAAANSDQKLTLAQPLSITTPAKGDNPEPEPVEAENIAINIETLTLDSESAPEGKLWIQAASVDGSFSVKLLVATLETYLNGQYLLLSNPTASDAVNYIDYSAAGNVELSYNGVTYTEFIADQEENASYMTAETGMPAADENAITIQLNTADKTKCFNCTFNGALYGGAVEIEETVRDLSQQLKEFVHDYKDGKHYLYFDSITTEAYLVFRDADNDGVLGAGESTSRGYEMYSVGNGFIVEESYYLESVDGDMGFNFTSGSFAIKHKADNTYIISVGDLKGKCTTQEDLYVKYTCPESGWEINCVGINGVRDEELYIESLTVTDNGDGSHNLYFKQTNFNMVEFKKVYGFVEGEAKTYYIASSLEKAQEIGGADVDCWIDGSKIQFWTMNYAFDDLRMDKGDFLSLDEDGTWRFVGTSSDSTNRFTFTFKE